MRSVRDFARFLAARVMVAAKVRLVSRFDAPLPDHEVDAAQVRQPLAAHRHGHAGPAGAGAARLAVAQARRQPDDAGGQPTALRHGEGGRGPHSGGTARLVANGQAQDDVARRDREGAVGGPPIGRVLAEQLELGLVAGGEEPAVGMQLEGLGARPRRAVEAASHEGLLPTGSHVPQAGGDLRVLRAGPGHGELPVTSGEPSSE